MLGIQWVCGRRICCEDWSGGGCLVCWGKLADTYILVQMAKGAVSRMAWSSSVVISAIPVPFLRTWIGVSANSVALFQSRRRE